MDKWIVYKPEDIGCFNCRCSVCNTEFFIPTRKGKVPYKHCPECGTKMTEDEATTDCAWK